MPAPRLVHRPPPYQDAQIDWLDELTADCPKKSARNNNDQCGAWCPDCRGCSRASPGPLYPKKRTCAVQSPMSALGQKQTYAVQQGMSALPPKADIRRRCWVLMKTRRRDQHVDRAPEYDSKQFPFSHFAHAMLAVTGRNRRCSLLPFDCATLLEVVANNLRRGHRRVVYVCEAGKLSVQAFPFTAQRVAHAL
jgi:hypothetical protein